jgi:hypothetical protein
MGTNRLITLLTLILLAPTASAIEVLPKGEFSCTYNLNGNNVNCTMYSNGKGLVFFDGNCEQVDDEVTFVKNNKCSHNRNGTENYICNETNATCHVSIFANGASSTSCKNKTNNYSSSYEILEDLVKKAKSGKCMPEL